MPPAPRRTAKNAQPVGGSRNAGGKKFYFSPFRTTTDRNPLTITGPDETLDEKPRALPRKQPLPSQSLKQRANSAGSLSS